MACDRGEGEGSGMQLTQLAMEAGVSSVKVPVSKSSFMEA